MADDAEKQADPLSSESASVNKTAQSASLDADREEDAESRSELPEAAAPTDDAPANSSLPNGFTATETTAPDEPNSVVTFDATISSKPKGPRMLRELKPTPLRATTEEANALFGDHEDQEGVRNRYKKTFNLDRRRDADAPTDTLDRTNKVTFRKLMSCRRPWMRSFHFAWLNFFLAFMGWFAVGPCIPDILESGIATESEVQTSTVLSLVGTIFIRFALGPACEAYGPRTVMVWNMTLGGIIVLLTAATQNGTGLMAVRFFVGFIGGTFVPCQFWCAMMFSGRVVGVTSGLAAGLGNTGAGVIVFFMAALLSGFTAAGYDAGTRWRLAMLIPGIMMVLVAIPTWFLTDDCPQGEWSQRKYNTQHDRYGQMAWLRGGGVRNQGKSMRYLMEWESYIASFHRYNYPARWAVQVYLTIATDSRVAGFKDWKAWMVGLQYAVCSGVELSILTGLTSYYRYEFGCDGSEQLRLQMKNFGNFTGFPEQDCFALSATSAAYIASIFGFTNFYGRALGGLFSDVLHRKMGVRGRHLANFVALLLMGIAMLVWAHMTDWRASAVILVLFSSVVHVSKGTVFAATPFVNPTGIGPVTGVVSAVGNIGGVVMATMYGQYLTSREVYVAQSFIVIVGSLTALGNPLQDPATKKSVWAFPICDKWFVEQDEDAYDPNQVEPGDPDESAGALRRVGTNVRSWGSSLRTNPMGWISFVQSKDKPHLPPPIASPTAAAHAGMGVIPEGEEEEEERASSPRVADAHRAKADLALV